MSARLVRCGNANVCNQYLPPVHSKHLRVHEVVSLVEGGRSIVHTPEVVVMQTVVLVSEFCHLLLITNEITSTAVL